MLFKKSMANNLENSSNSLEDYNLSGLGDLTDIQAESLSGGSGNQPSGVQGFTPILDKVELVFSPPAQNFTIALPEYGFGPVFH